MVKDLRGLDFGWLGAIIAVLVVAGLSFAAVYWPRAETDQAHIRNWFRSPAGGGAPANAVERLTVEQPCSHTHVSFRGYGLLRCDVRLGRMQLLPCFAFDSDDHIRAGGAKMVRYAGCEGLEYDAERRRFVPYR